MNDLIRNARGRSRPAGGGRRLARATRSIPLAMAAATFAAAAGRGDDRPGEAAIRAAAEGGVRALQRGEAAFAARENCGACHHQVLPALAVSIALDRGLAVDARLARESGLAFEDRIGDAPADFVAALGHGRGLDAGAFDAAFMLLEYSAHRREPDELARSLVLFLHRRQGDDGRWPGPSPRPPIQQGDIATTALALRCLQLFDPGSAPGRVERARAWLLSAGPATTGDHAFRLLGLGWAGADRADLDRAAAGLRRAQNPDGGWPQEPGLESDAFATGLALASLSRVAPAGEPAARAGLGYLVATRHADGSWAVRSRVRPLRRPCDDGTPHGRSSAASMAGTSWAVAALALLGGDDRGPGRAPTFLGPATPGVAP